MTFSTLILCNFIFEFPLHNHLNSAHFVGIFSHSSYNILYNFRKVLGIYTYVRRSRDRSAFAAAVQILCEIRNKTDGADSENAHFVFAFSASVLACVNNRTLERCVRAGIC